LDRDIAYVHLLAFGADTTQDLRRALRELLAHDPHGLILDLRGNGGGLLDSALEVHEAAEIPVPPRIEELAEDLERLGPTYVKLGQFLSTRSDFLPPAYMDVLSRLQDRAEEFPYERVEEIVAGELGVRVSKAFSRFEQKPYAAASLSQVHRAALRDGTEVVVKVQRPDVRGRMVRDLEAFEEAASFLEKHVATARRYQLRGTVAAFRRTLLHELDFKLEAQNLATMRENLKSFALIFVPRPIDDYTTSRVLTMEYVRGKKVTAVSPLRLIELDGGRLAVELFRAYLKQILVDGFYHADPHPGNIFLTDDGRIAVIDLGMVARVPDGLQDNMLRLLLAISEGKSSEGVEYAVELGEPMEDFDARAFSHAVSDLIGRYHDAKLGDIQVGRVLLEFFRVAAQSGLRFPSEFAMLGKALLNLDNIGRSLDPEFNPNAAVRAYASRILGLKVRRSFTLPELYEVFLDSKEFVEQLPRRVNKIMDLLAENQLTVQVNAIDEKYLMTGFQKVANRLTVGLILAAVIVGAAQMMHVRTHLLLFGYPAISIIFFVLAGLGGLWLAFAILFHDERIRQKPKV
ncbi:MAG: AarF/ABC1/UbiB kinase family protein, partial [Deltaproteobacteria bacterium]|nr:AarF/ABC1/UbiB kinase family protein [Deltaproteobacteria bacterium]